MSLPYPHLAFPPSGTGAALVVGRNQENSEHDSGVLKAAHLDADSAAATASVKFASASNSNVNAASSTHYNQTMSSGFYDDISDIFPQHVDERKINATGDDAGSRLLSRGSQSITSSISDMKALSNIFADRDSSMDIVPLSGNESAGLAGQNGYISTSTEHSKKVINAAKERHQRRVKDLNLDGEVAYRMMVEPYQK